VKGETGLLHEQSRWAVLLAIVVILIGLSISPMAGPLAAQTATAAACEGDECQPPAPPPDDPIPGTAVVEGPPNPPVVFPKERHKKPKHHRKHRKHRAGEGAHQRGRR
jgi:hypothetical protein